MKTPSKMQTTYQKSFSYTKLKWFMISN